MDLAKCWVNKTRLSQHIGFMQEANNSGSSQFKSRKAGLRQLKDYLKNGLSNKEGFTYVMPSIVEVPESKPYAARMKSSTG
jgi:hypothetical protein